MAGEGEAFVEIAGDVGGEELAIKTGEEVATKKLREREFEVKVAEDDLPTVSTDPDG